MNKKECEIAMKIGFFCFKECNNDYKKAVELIKSYKITRIECYFGGIIEITLQRPGLLIGKEGKNIIALKEYLKVPNINIKDDYEGQILENYLLGFATLSVSLQDYMET